MRDGPPGGIQTGRRRCSYPESMDCSTVFLNPASGFRRFDKPELRLRSPCNVAASTRFAAPNASGRTGSRTGLPHCTPPRQCGVDEATRLASPAPVGGITLGSSGA